MQLKHTISALALTALVSACANGSGSGGINKQEGGTLLGGLGGALLGSQVGKGKGQLVGVAAGTLLGAYLGNQIGASLDKADMAHYNRTSQQALETAPSGQTSSWRNPDSGNSGTITPTRTFQTSQGEYCREYTQTISIGGQLQEGVGVACRQADNTWRIKQ